MAENCEQFLFRLPSAHPELKAVHVDSCRSTNEVARRILEEPDSPDAVVVCAEYQEAGHGRRGHSWLSPRGVNLLFTLGIKPAKLGYQIDPRLPLCAGALIQRAIKNHTGIKLYCKWPNDLISDDGRKVAGIIILNAGDALYFGVGINVNSLRTDYPQELLGKVTSLRELGNKEFDRTELLFAIISQLMSYLVSKPGFRSGEMVEHWLECARTFGKPITVQRGDRLVEVVPLWIIPETGELLVVEEDGTESTISSAEYIDS